MRKQVNAIVARTAQVKKDIDEGRIHLPDPGAGCVWTLYDSGSSINAAVHDAHFPGSALDNRPVAGTYVNANGQPFTNKGQFEINFKSENMHDRKIVYLDAPVAMPITSSHLWNNEGYRTVLDEDYGETTHKET